MQRYVFFYLLVLRGAQMDAISTLTVRNDLRQILVCKEIWML